jgi:hypothetical protein
VKARLDNQRMKQKSNVAGIRRFKSPIAATVFQIACLGFLGGLGFIPGWERLFCFTGFFGFIGVACLIESIHRTKSRNV